ncbi:hypothetical protein Q1695_003799 [Nippostrongylus brasiliensis]|nr:hypothetical protein Q1695_003799 [Nippostrongylus brasiliensis]
MCIFFGENATQLDYPAAMANAAFAMRRKRFVTFGTHEHELCVCECAVGLSITAIHVPTPADYSLSCFRNVCLNGAKRNVKTNRMC